MARVSSSSKKTTRASFEDAVVGGSDGSDRFGARRRVAGSDCVAGASLCMASMAFFLATLFPPSSPPSQGMGWLPCRYGVTEYLAQCVRVSGCWSCQVMQTTHVHIVLGTQ